MPVALRPARSTARPAAATPGTSYAKADSRVTYTESSEPEAPWLMPSAGGGAAAGAHGC